MTDLKQRIQEILETEPYCEYGKVVNKSHVSDLIKKLIEDNYIPRPIIKRGKPAKFDPN